MPNLPRLALRLSDQLPAARCGELAGIAEAAGFSSVWFAENQFGRGVLPAATASAIGTRSLRIGIGVLNPYSRHPTLMAMEMGALDELAGGRVALGIGGGVPPAIRQMGCRYRPVAAVRDAVEIVRGMLAEEEVSYTGQVFSVDRVKLSYPVARRRMPILIGAVGDRMLQLCGELSDGLIISNMCPPAYTVRACGVVRAAAEAAGKRMLPEVVQYFPCSVRADGAEARRAVKTVIGRTLLAYMETFRGMPAVLTAFVDDNRIERAEFDAALGRLSRGEPASEVLDDRFVNAYGIAGTVSDCLRQFAVYGRSGVTEIALTFVGDDPAADIRLLGRELVKPT